MRTNRTSKPNQRAGATLLGGVFWSIVAVAGAMIGYLLTLTVAAFRAPRSTLQSRKPATRFAILIPAHNEALLLPDLLASIQAQRYPASLFDMHVVADNCSDATARIARDCGAIAHERSDEQRRGKGYALQWLLERVEAYGAYDAYVILDADSIITPAFLAVMDARLTRGERAIQAYYAVRHPDRSWSVSLRYVALAALHYLRPLGRVALGGTAGLKGNGMAFAADLLRRRAWSSALTEDIEFHMGLILDGERVTFAPDAVVEAEMPETLAAAHSQNIRWERGRLQMARQYVPALLRAAVTQRRFAPLDAAAEHVIPPFSILSGISLALLGVAALSPQPGKKARIAAGLGLLAGQAVYVLSSLKLAGAPRRVYAALLYAPLFVLWKLRLYARVLLGRDREGWTRTQRNREQTGGGIHVNH